MVMKYFVLAVACFSLFCFAWARKRFFKRSSQTPVGRNGLRLFGSASGLLVVVHLVFGSPSMPIAFLGFGSGLMIFSLLIFWWAVKSFSGEAPYIASTPGEIVFLNTRGPYKYVRHPFYSSYMLFWLGAFASIQTVDVLLAVIILFGIYFIVARREEESILSSSFGCAYVAYKKRTGMFFPALFRF